MFPYLKPWLKDVASLLSGSGENFKEIKGYVKSLHETLNSTDSRGFIDSFLIHKQNTEVTPLMMELVLWNMYSILRRFRQQTAM